MITRVYCRCCCNRKVIVHRGWLRLYGRNIHEVVRVIREHFHWHHGEKP